MNKEDIQILINELEAYRILDGRPFDFGTGLIENDSSFGSEDVYYRMDIQSLEELLLDYKVVNTKKKKVRLNRYARKKIRNRRLNRLNRTKTITVSYSDDKRRLIHYYESGRRGHAKWRSRKVVRKSSDFSTKKSNSYRKLYDYWNDIW